MKIPNVDQNTYPSLMIKIPNFEKKIVLNFEKKKVPNFEKKKKK